MAALKAFLVVAILALSACATPNAERARAPETLFDDALFAAPTEQVDAARIFALSDGMRRFLDTELAPLVRKRGARDALLEALYQRDLLRLEYESAVTRTAAEAFEARTGNCLSLMIMTAAFARELGIEVRFQSAYLEERWSRHGNLLLRSGHVNVTLGRWIGDQGITSRVMIDFLPEKELRALRVNEIPESTVVAMFMNNRAAEALVQDRFDDAYAWAREAVRAEPAFLAAQNTLGVVYLRRNALDRARAVFDHVLAADPSHTRALANLIEVAHRQGRDAEASRLTQRLAQLEPEPPLYFLNLGLAALQKGDYRAARDLFTKEANRGDDVPEVHYWLGLSLYRLGDHELAMRELTVAAQMSASRSERDLYSAKLDWLRAHQTN